MRLARSMEATYCRLGPPGTFIFHSRQKRRSEANLLGFVAERPLAALTPIGYLQAPTAL